MIYDDTIDIKYEQQDADGSGGFTSTTKTRSSDVACNFQKRDEISSQRRRELIGDTTEVQYNYLVFMPVSTSYEDTDHIVYDSKQYKITGSVKGRLRTILTLKEQQ